MQKRRIMNLETIQAIGNALSPDQYLAAVVPTQSCTALLRQSLARRVCIEHAQYVRVTDLKANRPNTISCNSIRLVVYSL